MKVLEAILINCLKYLVKITEASSKPKKSYLKHSIEKKLSVSVSINVSYARAATIHH